MAEDPTEAAVPQTPEEILEGAWARVGRVNPPLDEPAPGKEWHFAIGAQWALGCAGLLTDEQIGRWEAHGKAETERLRGQ